MIPRACLVLTGPTLKDCQKQLERARAHIDMAELRVDLLNHWTVSELNAFSEGVDVPLILTLRRVRDGGQWSGPAEQRRALFEGARAGQWAWWDVEDDDRLPELEARWLESGKQLVVSFHVFEGLPTDWTDRVRSAEGPGIVAKAAVYPKNSADFDRFVEQALSLPEGTRVLVAMGDFGFASRVLCARLGSQWTYVASDKPPAPGQIDAATLQNLYRFRHQTASTPVFGIVGNPIFHTKSPLIHNAGLARLGLEGTYLPFLADDLPVFLKTADRLGVQGLSCTIPFKEDVLLSLTQSSPAVQATGACNTLWKGPDHRWAGDNTDAPGFLSPLRELLDDELAGLRVTVIGTGGAARGIVWALKQAGARVVVLGRTPDKAQAVAGDFGVEWAPLGPESRLVVEEHSDLIVQTTSVGMGDQTDQDPLDWYEFTGREIAYDIVYAPRWTRFLTRAKDAGCRLLFGEDMLAGQAFGQFRRFTGREYPVEVLPLQRSGA